MARKIHLSAQVDERLLRKVKRLRRLLAEQRGDNVSTSAVIRILLLLGLRAAEGLTPAKLLALAEEEGLI